MATLTIRQLDDDVYDRLRSRARANKRSLEAEARVILEDATPVRDPKRLKAVVDELIAKYREDIAKDGFDDTDSVADIRAIRDESDRH